MKKTALQKKWEKIASESGWVENKDPAAKERILARNQKLRENKSASINTRIEPSEKEKFISVKKSFIGRKPNTKYYMTKQGTKAFDDHLKTLEKLIKSQKET